MGRRLVSSQFTNQANQSQFDQGRPLVFPQPEQESIMNFFLLLFVLIATLQLSSCRLPAPDSSDDVFLQELELELQAEVEECMGRTEESEYVIYGSPVNCENCCKDCLKNWDDLGYLTDPDYTSSDCRFYCLEIKNKC